MSRWRALAAARDVANADVRDAYVDALETLHLVAAALDVAVNENELLDAVDDLRRDVNVANEERDDADTRCIAAEERLEPNVQRVGELETENARLQKAIDALTEEAIARQPMLDAYADLLARARTFVTFAEKHGVKATHCRAVPGAGTPTKDSGATRRNGRKRL